jgi:hypothetical protein
MRASCGRSRSRAKTGASASNARALPRRKSAATECAACSPPRQSSRSRCAATSSQPPGASASTSARAVVAVMGPRAAARRGGGTRSSRTSRRRWTSGPARNARRARNPSASGVDFAVLARDAGSASSSGTMVRIARPSHARASARTASSRSRHGAALLGASAAEILSVASTPRSSVARTKKTHACRSEPASARSFAIVSRGGGPGSDARASAASDRPGNDASSEANTTPIVRVCLTLRSRRRVFP